MRYVYLFEKISGKEGTALLERKSGKPGGGALGLVANRKRLQGNLGATLLIGEPARQPASHLPGKAGKRLRQPVVRVFGIAGEEFVPAFAGQYHLNALSRQARDSI